MSESCLYLNVYSPDFRRKHSKLAPVMIWIHGGGFVSGSAQSSMYNPKHLVQEGVLVVTVNYRLGPLGFLCLPSVGIEGNMGLKDQQMSFAWVKENIGYFGGNSGDVTIFGQSAGGASVHLHYLSESSRQYFHKAIAQSGSAFNQWVFQKDPDKRARKLAELTGCQDPFNDTLVYETLMRADAKTLTELQYQVMSDEERSVVVNFPFTPTVERQESVDPLVLENPLRAIRKQFSKDIPLIMGITSEEGIGLASHVSSFLDEYERYFSTQLIPFTLMVSEENERREAAEMIREFFFGSVSLSQDSLLNMVRVLGDNGNKFAGYLTAELHFRYQKSSPVFFYIFSYISELNKLRKLSNTPDSLPGASHGDDLCYLFSSSFFDTDSIDSDSDAFAYRQQMCKLWTDFAKFGEPTPDDSAGFRWQPLNTDTDDFHLNALELNKIPKMIVDPFAERFNFWKALFKQYNGGHLNPKIWNY
ncbi:venom carboxylesterase-6-like [Uranotaenia lowii]|uniref:venom carboxylesterase-6-like n=1 Tax=Uranotaenia lowii TaxID=190385 RepID=UPI002479D011|nr:venom carboxylesterase-6-like [Uranotaenia lowii]XP_055610915.1 venom carboxylesterase-6-like [Uranotaenia lowii]